MELENFHNWSKKKESTWPGIGRSTLYTSCTPYNPVDAFFHDKVSSTCLLRTIPSNSGKQLLSGGISQSNHPLLHLNSQTQISFSQHPISPIEACFCTELKYNLLYLEGRTSRSNHVPKLQFFSSPTFHTTFLSNHWFPTPIPHTSAKSFHQVESLMDLLLTRIWLSSPYFDFNTLCHQTFW